MAEEKEAEDERIVRCSDGRLRQCRARRTGWTARRRRIFLDHFAATCNATASALAAGMHPRSVFALRGRDPQFAAEWDAALHDAQARLAGKLIVYAETRGETAAGGDGAQDELAGFDPKLALQMLALHRDRLSGRQRRGGPRPRTAPREEVEAAVLKLLRKIEKRHRGAA